MTNEQIVEKLADLPLVVRGSQDEVFKTVRELQEAARQVSVSLLDSDSQAAEKRVAVLHSLGISGIGGSINDFWNRLNNLQAEERIVFCQALHQLCEIMGHNNEYRCTSCEQIGARNAEGYYTGARFFDGTKDDYRPRTLNHR